MHLGHKRPLKSANRRLRVETLFRMRRRGDQKTHKPRLDLEGLLTEGS